MHIVFAATIGKVTESWLERVQCGFIGFYRHQVFWFDEQPEADSDICTQE